MLVGSSADDVISIVFDTSTTKARFNVLKLSFIGWELPVCMEAFRLEL